MLALVDDVLGAGVERGEHELVLGRRLAATRTMPLRSNCQATAPGSPSSRRCFVKTAADLGAGAVAVVGQHLDEERHAAGRVALVGDLLVDDALELAGAPLDRPLDRVERHRGVAGLLEHRAQRRVRVGSPPPSRAATSTWRISLAKSLPRALSVAPFLCLIVAHLE